MKINIRTISVTISIIALFASVLPIGITWVRYIDDIVPLSFGIIWIYGLINKRKNKKGLYKIGFLLLAICAIGMVSNLVSSLAKPYPILIDMYSFLKIFFVYLGTYSLLGEKENVAEKVINHTAKFSGAFIIVGFIFGVLNFLGVVNMYDNLRFGIKTYHFIFSNASQYGVLVGVALAFVIYSKPKPKCLFLLEIMALATMIMTLKGMSLIIVAVYISMNLVAHRKVKIRQIVLVGMVLVFILRYQIYTYLLDATAPRAIFLRYGAITANKYFPLGSGFATWGSDAAGKYYSPLYYEYGLNNRNVFIYDYAGGTALDDAYLGMAIGQFGWIGTALLATIFAIIGKRLFLLQNGDEKSKFITFALFTSLCGMAVMTGSIKGTPGQLMMLCIQIYCIVTQSHRKKQMI